MEPSICLVMIARNEAKVLPRSLASAKPLVDRYVICLNNTTDNSVEVIAETMRGLFGAVHADCRWVNMAHNRNEALELAKSKVFGGGTDNYVLVCDADDAFEYDDKDVLRNAIKRDPHDAYNIMTHSGSFAYEQMRLFRADRGYQYRGARHEVILPLVNVAPKPIEGIIYRCIGGGFEATGEGALSAEQLAAREREKYLRHASELEAELKSQGEAVDNRTVFYLAQSYRDASQADKAEANYLRRTTLGGFQEEVFISWLNIGRLRLKRGDEGGALVAYLAAIEANPARYPEVCCDLIRYFNDTGRYNLSHVFDTAIYGKIPPGLFVDTSVYKWRLKMESAVAYWWRGDKAFAKILFTELLDVVPAAQRAIVENNISMC